jgi:inosine-uridine nucleoside N-ribohydrolase
MDGLSNISETHPHFTPEELGVGEVHQYLDISPKSASEAMLDLLRSEPEGTVTIVAIGPRK